MVSIPKESKPIPTPALVGILTCVMVVSWAVQTFAMKMEFSPSLYISEDYTDNHFQTDTDKREEFYTTYGVGLSLGFLERTGQAVLSYSPEFKDYKNNYESDGWEHNASFAGNLNPSKQVAVDFSFNYDGHGDDNQGDTWQHGAYVGTAIQVTRHTDLTLSGDYTKSYDRQVRTGEWKESEDTSITTKVTHQFGEMNSLDLGYTYSFDNYADLDSDEYESHEPSAFISFWFTPQWGFDSNISFESRTYEIDEDEKIYTGDIRLIKKITRHFDTYVKYKHTRTNRDSGDESVYNPSVGFDWSITEDSGLSLGLGYLIQEWDTETDSGLFVDLDAFKTFDFSRRGTLTLSASSGYDASSDDAASLGFNVYYQAGFLYSYEVTKRLSADLDGSYIRDEYTEPDVNRVDNTTNLGLSLSWMPLRWMNIRFSYNFEDYTSDSDTIAEYTENKATMMVTLYPLRTLPAKELISRSDFDKRIFKN
ncbi:conserved hypothetical protein [Desulforapulum autotrophicum HRM2]|uniref:Uncharacterized protein n=1 Tax=Desulforapulum autotrophicum (strain ATCC 43914 / DSM 3382 / VKM B-1955 / HRM2) TaxID=177437 RepID=C0QCJ5_DESAH|nr:outer membrane beta-barrel protein [Desulforapulum autotrophicum]ACN15072.1 conserved hypothetical protein [Desulforapulum autotrophicum HRM2]